MSKTDHHKIPATGVPHLEAIPSNLAKRRRPLKKVSPIIKLAKLLSQTFKQPLGLPTPDQAPEMKQLTLEVAELLEYRRTHPHWR